MVQYDGSKFLGWQIQKEGRTVQGLLENNFKKISNSKGHVKVYGAGRTDTGVHAWAQVAHVDLKTKLNEQDIQNALNANLPLDCRIINIAKFIPDFIILNLEKTDNIVNNMLMRGYGTTSPRSIYPHIKFRLYD